MKISKLIERYPSLKSVVEEIIRMKAEGKPYPKIKQYWETTVKQLYPNNPPRCPSKSTLWRKEVRRKELVLDQAQSTQGLEKCHACERYYPSFELQQTWVRLPDDKPFDCGRLCGDCRHRVNLMVLGKMDADGNFINQSRKEFNIEDYIYIGRRNHRGYSGGNPRED